MKPVPRLLVQTGITSVLAVVLSFAVPVSIDRNAYARAVENYVNNPSAENDRILRAESAENQRIVRTTRIEVAGVLFVLMNASWLSIRKWTTKSPSP
jgi:DTW domain-containing protein YfiP